VGQRLVEKVSPGHWKTTTRIAALGLRGIRCSTVADGAVNGDVFQAFAQQVLVPQLRPGDVVVMDNLSSHKRTRTRELIPGRRGERVVPAALFAGPQSHRDDLRQGQAVAAIAGLPDARRVMDEEAVGAGSDHFFRRGQLLPALWIHATNELGML